MTYRNRISWLRLCSLFLVVRIGTAFEGGTSLQDEDDYDYGGIEDDFVNPIGGRKPRDLSVVNFRDEYAYSSSGNEEVQVVNGDLTTSRPGSTLSRDGEGKAVKGDGSLSSVQPISRDDNSSASNGFTDGAVTVSDFFSTVGNDVTTLTDSAETLPPPLMPKLIFVSVENTTIGENVTALATVGDVVTVVFTCEGTGEIFHEEFLLSRAPLGESSTEKLFMEEKRCTEDHCSGWRLKFSNESLILTMVNVSVADAGIYRFYCQLSSRKIHFKLVVANESSSSIDEGAGETDEDRDPFGGFPKEIVFEKPFTLTCASPRLTGAPSSIELHHYKKIQSLYSLKEVQVDEDETADRKSFTFSLNLTCGSASKSFSFLFPPRRVDVSFETIKHVKGCGPTLVTCVANANPAATFKLFVEEEKEDTEDDDEASEKRPRPLVPLVVNRTCRGEKVDDAREDDDDDDDNGGTFVVNYVGRLVCEASNMHGTKRAVTEITITPTSSHIALNIVIVIVIVVLTILIAVIVQRVLVVRRRNVGTRDDGKPRNEGRYSFKEASNTSNTSKTGDVAATKLANVEEEVGTNL